MRDVTDNIIVSVKEFPTCNYVFTVATPFLCKHPEFKPPVGRLCCAHRELVDDASCATVLCELLGVSAAVR
jgi:hypothetical protein